MPALTPGQRRFLRARAHHLKPVVLVGAAGLHEAVLAEIDAALAHHELIKVRLPGDRGRREALAADIAGRCGASLVQAIGRMAVFYRPAEPPVLRLPRD